ncbi:MAG: hypothetical protein N2170_01650 [Bacteroidia bacterium]|nr:hypothetical protein [Bacteroidia bacterium]
MALPMTIEEAKELIKEFLREPELRKLVEQELSQYFALKEPTELRIDRLYQELVRLREESERRWEVFESELKALRVRMEEKDAEYQRRWEEQNAEYQRRWEKHEKHLEEHYRELVELRKLFKECRGYRGSLGLSNGAYLS